MTAHIEIIPQTVIDGFLTNSMSIKNIVEDAAALKRGGVSVGYDEAQVRGWLGIQAPDMQRAYTDEEKNAIKGSFDSVYRGLVQKAEYRHAGPRTIHMTFGSPGSGKTTLAYALAHELGAAMIDVNEVQKMLPSYQQDKQAWGDTPTGLLAAYEAHRWEANYLANRAINRALSDGYNLVYGTTATSPAALLIYDAAEKQGLHIHTRMVVAPEDVRLQSCQQRCFGSEQSGAGDGLPIPQEHVISKNLAFPGMVAKHFAKAAEVSLYYRAATNEPAQLFAHAHGGRIVVFSQAAARQAEKEMQKYKPDFSFDTDIAAPYQNQPRWG